MLVLTRKSGEAILIGDEIRIRILKASGSRVRVGIEAPGDLRILRQKAEPKASAPVNLAADACDPTASGVNRLRHSSARELATAER